MAVESVRLQMKRLCFLAGLATVLGLGQMNPAQATRSEAACEALYEAVQSDARIKLPKDRARQMERAEPSCLGTGMFDVWTALDYLAAGDVDNAVRVAEHALRKTPNARPNLLHVLVRADLSRGAIEQAARKGESIAAEYPRYSPIFGELAGIATKRQDWARALTYARRGYEIEGSAVSLLSMASALHQLDRHEEAVAAVRRALELEPQRIGKITGVLEAVFSLAMLNRRAEAADLARRHIEANPNWRANSTFARAAEELGVAKAGR